MPDELEELIGTLTPEEKTLLRSELQKLLPQEPARPKYKPGFRVATPEEAEAATAVLDRPSPLTEWKKQHSWEGVMGPAFAEMDKAQKKASDTSSALNPVRLLMGEHTLGEVRDAAGAQLSALSKTVAPVFAPISHVLEDAFGNPAQEARGATLGAEVDRLARLVVRAPVDIPVGAAQELTEVPGIKQGLEFLVGQEGRQAVGELLPFASGELARLGFSGLEKIGGARVAELTARDVSKLKYAAQPPEILGPPLPPHMGEELGPAGIPRGPLTPDVPSEYKPIAGHLPYNGPMTPEGPYGPQVKETGTATPPTFQTVATVPEVPSEFKPVAGYLPYNGPMTPEGPHGPQIVERGTATQQPLRNSPAFQEQMRKQAEAARPGFPEVTDPDSPWFSPQSADPATMEESYLRQQSTGAPGQIEMEKQLSTLGEKKKTGDDLSKRDAEKIIKAAEQSKIDATRPAPKAPSAEDVAWWNEPRQPRQAQKPAEAPQRPAAAPAAPKAPEVVPPAADAAAPVPEPTLGTAKSPLEQVSKKLDVTFEEGQSSGVQGTRSGEAKPRGTLGRPKSVRDTTAAAQAKMGAILNSISDKLPYFRDILNARMEGRDPTGTGGRAMLRDLDPSEIATLWEKMREEIPDVTPEDLHYALTGKTRVSEAFKEAVPDPYKAPEALQTAPTPEPPKPSAPVVKDTTPLAHEVQTTKPVVVRKATLGKPKVVEASPSPPPGETLEQAIDRTTQEHKANLAERASTYEALAAEGLKKPTIDNLKVLKAWMVNQISKRGMSIAHPDELAKAISDAVSKKKAAEQAPVASGASDTGVRNMTRAQVEAEWVARMRQRVVEDGLTPDVEDLKHQAHVMEDRKLDQDVLNMRDDGAPAAPSAPDVPDAPVAPDLSPAGGAAASQPYVRTANDMSGSTLLRNYARLMVDKLAETEPNYKKDMKSSILRFESDTEQALKKGRITEDQMRAALNEAYAQEDAPRESGGGFRQGGSLRRGGSESGQIINPADAVVKIGKGLGHAVAQSVKSIADTLQDLGPEGSDLARRLTAVMTDTARDVGDWHHRIWQPGWDALSPKAKDFLRKHGTEAIDNPDMPMPADAAEFINTRRKLMKINAGENLFIEDKIGLRRSHMLPERHVDHVLTDEAAARYEAQDPATMERWRQMNPGRRFPLDEMAEAPNRYTSDYLKPTNRNALPREYNWPVEDLEQNLEKLDKSYMRRMAQYQAEMKHLGYSDLMEGGDVSSQGEYGKLLAKIKDTHGAEAARHVEDMMRNALGRGDMGEWNPGSKAGKGLVGVINQAVATYYLAGNVQGAAGNLMSGGLSADALVRHPKVLIQSLAELAEKGPLETYRKGVNEGVIPSLLHDYSHVEVVDAAQALGHAGRVIRDAVFLPYSAANTVLRTMLYAGSEAKLKALARDLRAGGSARQGALNQLGSEMRLFPEEIDRIEKGEHTQHDLNKFQQQWIKHTSGTATAEERPNWMHSTNPLLRMLGNLRGSSAMTANRTLRGPILEARNGRPARLMLTFTGAVAGAYALDKAWEQMFGPDPRDKDIKKPEEIAALYDAGHNKQAGEEALKWLTDHIQKSWFMGQLGGATANAARAYQRTKGEGWDLARKLTNAAMNIIQLRGSGETFSWPPQGVRNVQMLMKEQERKKAVLGAAK